MGKASVLFRPCILKNYLNGNPKFRTYCFSNGEVEMKGTIEKVQNNFIVYCKKSGQSFSNESLEIMSKALKAFGFEMAENQISEMAKEFEEECLSHLNPGDIGKVSIEHLYNWISDYLQLLSNNKESESLVLST